MGDRKNGEVAAKILGRLGEGGWDRRKKTKRRRGGERRGRRGQKDPGAVYEIIKKPWE